MEKLIKPVMIRFTESGEKELHALARSRSLEVSEYIRHLILQDKNVQYQQWLSVNELFSKYDSKSTESVDNSV